jgi:hypothetical protein
MPALQVLLTAVVVVGLGYDAYVHFDLAASYDAVKTSTLSQGDLFRVEGAAAALAALLVLVRPRRYTVLFAFLVAAAGFAAVLVYRYIDIKGLGPVPSMYEPAWFPEKIHSAYAEGIAALAAAALLATLRHQHRRGSVGNPTGDGRTPQRGLPSPSATPGDPTR